MTVTPHQLATTAELLLKHRGLSTPEQKCIGWSEQKYISDAGEKIPNWGSSRQASSLGGIIRRGIGAGRGEALGTEHASPFIER
jgi:hypothetical protein